MVVVLQREELPSEVLPGRLLQRAIGKASASSSGKMTVAFCRYAAESGRMQPHHHAEETIYIIDARDGWVRYGPNSSQIESKVAVRAGTILHFPALEWHVFEYADGGFIDAVCIYGQVDNIRPEDMPDGQTSA